MSLLDLGDRYPAREEDGCRHDENGCVHEEGGIQGECGIEEVKPARAALLLDRLTDLPCLHQRRMQIEVVRHDRRAENGHGQIDTLIIEGRYEATRDRSNIGPGEIDFD